MTHQSFSSSSSIQNQNFNYNHEINTLNSNLRLPNIDNFINTLRFIGTCNVIPYHSLSCLQILQNSSIHNIQPQNDQDSLGEHIKEETNQYFQSTTKKKKNRCTCKKTNCSKMYCQCYANGKSCNQDCVCIGCINQENFNENNFNNEFHPQTALKSHQHTKKCNCKKSQCQKKYCQCFSAGVACSQSCKCVGCCNEPKTQEPPEKQTKGLLLKSINNIPDLRVEFKWH